MNNNIITRSSEPWKDPVTGEIYPNGRPDTDDVIKFCTNCGSVLSKDALICKECGQQVDKSVYSAEPRRQIQRQTPQEPQEPPGPQQPANSGGSPSFYTPNLNTANGERNRLVSLLLCLFAGFLGAHRFYEGKVGMGLLYLFTGGLFGIGILVDIIRIARLPDTYRP